MIYAIESHSLRGEQGHHVCREPMKICRSIQALSDARLVRDDDKRVSMITQQSQAFENAGQHMKFVNVMNVSEFGIDDAVAIEKYRATQVITHVAHEIGGNPRERRCR